MAFVDVGRPLHFVVDAPSFLPDAEVAVSNSVCFVLHQFEFHE